MSTDSVVPVRNHLLAGLPAHELAPLIAASARTTLSVGQVLAEPNEPVECVYFPTGAVISVITATGEGPALATGMIGDDAMLGALLVLGTEQWPNRAIVQNTGQALCVAATDFRDGLGKSPELQRTLERYLYMLIVQLGQTAACNRFHRIERRLARWLLMTHDRAPADELTITHECLANMLGVRRVGVTMAASALQDRGLIRCQRGSLTIVDRHGLEAAACGCYAADRDTRARAMG